MTKRGTDGTQGFWSRRGFLTVMGTSAIGLLLTRCSAEKRALGFRPQAKSTTPFITPNEDFYLVAVEPSYRPSVGHDSVDAQWKLDLVGPDGAYRHLRYPDLFKQATRTIHYTFECIGNPVGGELIGNAQWHVIPLREILAQVSVGSRQVRAVLFEGLDDFYSSVSVERAMDAGAFLALRMNGKPAPRRAASRPG